MCHVMHTLLSAWYLTAAVVNRRWIADTLLLFACSIMPYIVAIVATLDESGTLS